MPIESGTPLRKRSTNLAQGVVDALTQRILLGQLKPGEKLPSESTIVLEHGVSRTVVREAISKLQASGLVEARHGIGTFVLEQQAQQGLRLHVDTVASVRNMLELRQDPDAARAAMVLHLTNSRDRFSGEHGR